MIRVAMDARLEKEHLVKSLTVIGELYNQAGLNNKAKFDMLRKVAMNYTRLAELLLFKGPGNYHSLKNAIFDYVRNCEHVRNCEAFILNFSFDDSRPAMGPSAINTLLKDVENVEARLDVKLEVLSDQFENLTLTLNKETKDTERPQVFCFYCQNEEP